MSIQTATLALALALTSFDAIGADLPVIDPGWIGQSVDDLRAATPGITWQQEDASSPRLLATDYVTWSNMNFDARVFYYANTVDEVDFTHTAPVNSTSQCEHQFFILVEALEERFGQFHWSVRLLPGREYLVDTSAARRSWSADGCATQCVRSRESNSRTRT